MVGVIICVNVHACALCQWPLFSCNVEKIGEPGDEATSLPRSWINNKYNNGLLHVMHVHSNASTLQTLVQVIKGVFCLYLHEYIG